MRLILFISTLAVSVLALAIVVTLRDFVRTLAIQGLAAT